MHVRPCCLTTFQSSSNVNWVCTLPAKQLWPMESTPSDQHCLRLCWVLQEVLHFRHQVEFLLEMISPNPWQIFSKISNSLCLFYPGSFWMYWTQVTYSFYMLKDWWRAINSLKYFNAQFCELTLDNKKQAIGLWYLSERFLSVLKSF